MTEFVYLLCKTLLHVVHCFFQAAVHDPCIMLCHTCGGMAEHDGNILKRHIVGKRDRSPESVTGNVRGQILLNAAEIGYFLEIAVHLLVAHDGQTASFLNAGRMFLVFLQYGQGYGQQWNIADGRGLPTVFQFDPSFSYPPVSEIVLYQILFRLATSENARPVKHAKTKTSLTSSSRGMVNFFFITVCNSS